MYNVYYLMTTESKSRSRFRLSRKNINADKKETPTDSSSDFLHDRSSTKKQLLVWVGILLFLTAGTVLAVLYARGYRLSFGQGEPKVSRTGILNVASSPKGAQVYINDHLSAATDDSINLTPGKYTIRVVKDGYSDWQKDVDIREEEVSAIEALLFPKAPSLQSISTLGVEEAVIDPTGTKLAFKIASASARQNGIYIFDMTQRPLPILQGQGSSQLADDTRARFSEANISFSPDGKQLLASISATVEGVDEPESDLATYYLLETDEFNDSPPDITATIFATLDLWEEQKRAKETARVRSLKPDVATFYRKNFTVLSWSPDEKKILYQASTSAEMPIFMNPRRIGNNFRYERRDLEKNAVYVYDIAEDINTRVVEPVENICRGDTQKDCSATFTWFPNSDHIIYVGDKKINILEDDGANMVTMYAGHFIGHYVFPWPDGSRIVILTDLGNTSVPPTLYTIGLK
jgi:hypothetical protein